MSIKNYLEEAIALMASSYHKVIKVNLTDDSFVYVKEDKDELGRDGFSLTSFRELIAEYAVSGNIHQDDIKNFISFADSNKIREHFSTKRDTLILKYLRRDTEDYKWAQIEVMACEDYSKEHENIFVFVRDIHDAYSRELEIKKDLEYYCNYDLLSGVHNFFAYKGLCANYALTNKSEPIGVVFADLNGLKLINDLKGHEQGDALVMDFAETLMECFNPEDCYRIAGDEFAVISFGCSKGTFNSKSEAFYELINKKSIPLAAIGWSFSENAGSIEELVSDAESRMYRDKENFYESHPEYRRSAVEKKYKLEMQNVIWSLAESFGNLFLVDMEENSYKLLRRIDEYGGRIPENGTYSDLNEIYCNRCVNENDAHLRRLVGSYEYLKENLKSDPIISCDYRLVDGTWKRTDFKLLEKNEAGEVSKMLIMSYKPDKKRIEKLAEHKSMEIAYHIINGLCSEYNFLAVIDVATGKLMFYKNDGLPQVLVEYASEKKYQDAIELYHDRFVYEEDKDVFLAATSLDTVIDGLRIAPKYSFRFRSNQRLHGGCELSNSEWNYIYTDNGKKIIFATRQVSDEMIDAYENMDEEDDY